MSVVNYGKRTGSKLLREVSLHTWADIISCSCLLSFPNKCIRWNNINVVSPKNGYWRIFPHPARANTLYTMCRWHHVMRLNERGDVDSVWTERGGVREASRLPCCYHGNWQVDFLVAGSWTAAKHHSSLSVCGPFPTEHLAESVQVRSRRPRNLKTPERPPLLHLAPPSSLLIYLPLAFSFCRQLPAHLPPFFFFPLPPLCQLLSLSVSLSFISYPQSERIPAEEWHLEDLALLLLSLHWG